MNTCGQCHHLNPGDAQFCGRCGHVLGHTTQTIAQSRPSTSGAGGSMGGNRYTIEALLGEGSMGQVFCAVDTRLSRKVALKVLNAELISHPTARKRMTQEAKALARINHPNVVRIFDVFDEGPNLVLVLELVTGGSLEQALSQGKMLESTAVPMMCEILTGLQAIHEAGLVHRDLKPANILLKDRIPKLTDLGVAHDSTKRSETRLGARLGTPEYMSPEQHRGQPVDVRSDIYACGVVLYEMLSGNVPFTGDSDFDVASAHVRAAVDMSVLKSVASKAVQQIIAHAMAKEAPERWESAQVMCAALTENEYPKQPAARPTSKRGNNVRPNRYWVRGADQKTYGPADIPTLQAWVKQGKVTALSMICREQDPTRQWIQAERLIELDLCASKPGRGIGRPARYWVRGSDQKTYGPVDVPTLRSWVRGGLVTSHTLVCRENDPNHHWIRVRGIHELNVRF